MTQVRDYQRSACYRWEHEVVEPRGGAWVEFDDIQNLVNYIWNKEGLRYPPRVEPLNALNSATATGGRLEVHFRERVQTWVVLHELAHSMTSTFEGQSVGHRRPWLGIYMRLIERYLGIPMLVLTSTATRAGLDFDITAAPVFLD